MSTQANKLQLHFFLLMKQKLGYYLIILSEWIDKMDLPLLKSNLEVSTDLIKYFRFHDMFP